MNKVVKILLGMLTPFLLFYNWVLSHKKGKAKIICLLLHNIEPQHYEVLEKLLIKTQKDFGFISPEVLFKKDAFKKSVFGRKVLLTFDDGFYSNKLVAQTILKRLGIKAVFFIPTGFIDLTGSNADTFIKDNFCMTLKQANNSYRAMTWNDLIELQSEGHFIGSHTQNHIKLSTVDDMDKLAYEIKGSKALLEERLQGEIHFFAFPFGDFASISSKAFALIRESYQYVFSGIRGTYTVDQTSCVVHRQSIHLHNTFWYNRFLIHGGCNFLYRQKVREMQKMEFFNT